MAYSNNPYKPKARAAYEAAARATCSSSRN